jgi:hypothetical protein
METSSRTATTFSVLLLLTLTFFLVAAVRKTSSSSGLQNKRIFENKIPSSVPIKIKIKKEKVESFEDLNSEKWASEFELELTNTGDKPIYFIYITIVTDVKDAAQRIVFPIYYGRGELGDIVTRPIGTDVPIKPGDTYVMKMGPVGGWEKLVREGRVPQAGKFTAVLQAISFGDGTGYFGTTPYPPSQRASSRLLDGSDRPKGDLNIPGLT